MGVWEKVEALENKNHKLIKSLDDRVSGYSPSLGVCSTCCHLSKRKTKLLHEEYWCDCSYQAREYVPFTRPSKTDPILECTEYSERGRLSLQDMYLMATLIDIRKPIGFGCDEVVITKPEETEG